MLKQLANLVKIAKQKLETQERLLIRNQNLIANKRSDIDAINIAIAQTPLPTSGSFSAYANQKAAITAHLYEIEELQDQIAILRQEQERIKKQIRTAHIEHEKMLHLYNKAKDEQILEQNKLESKTLDEVTIILHSNTKNKE